MVPLVARKTALKALSTTSYTTVAGGSPLRQSAWAKGTYMLF